MIGGLIVLVLFILLAMYRVPIYMALIVPSIIYLVLFDVPAILAAQRMIRSLDSFVLLTIPLFIFVGTLMNESGVTDVIVEFSRNLVGHITGGLAQVNVITSLIFSGISGSALADVGGVGRVLIRAMETEGYDRSYAAALTSASATTGPIFPPSIPLILFGLIANVSVLSLLLAGVVPGVLTTVMLMGGVYVIGRRDSHPKSSRAEFSTLVTSFSRSFPALLTPVILIAGMVGGYFTPTEAAAVTVLYILIINTFIYRVWNLVYIFTAGKEAAKTSGMILLILAGASLFSWVMAVEQVDQLFAGLLFAISSNVLVALLVANVIILVIGLFLEPIAALIMVVPIMVPPLTELGVDPVHLGIIIVFNLMIGLLTPPLGLSLFITSDIADAPLEEVVSELKPFYLLLIGVLLLITYVPQVSLLFPSLAK